MKKRALLIIFCLLSVLWTGFIWINSMQSGEVSGEMSGSFTSTINAFLGAILDGVEISGLFVRKTAHFLEFALLALLFCSDIYILSDFDRNTPASKLCFLWLALPCASAIAAVDETIQVFVDGRVGALTDVLIDSAGALTATAIFFLIAVLRRKPAARP